MAERTATKLLFTGDFFPGNTITDIGTDLLELAETADVVLVNVEGPLTEHGTPLPDESLQLRSSPENVNVL